MLFAAYTLVLTLTSVLAVRPPEPPSSPSTIHFTISRRGGPFPTSDVANLTYLSEQLAAAEARFDLTRREIRGNKVVRVAKPRGGGGLKENGVLLGEVGRDGNWFAKLEMGDPPQGIELDLDMLTSDFFVQSTTSHQGSEYVDVASSSYQGSNQHPFPSCLCPSEEILLPTINESRSISFAHCRPSKSSIDTLRKCGSMLGLAPSYSLSQTKTPSLIKQLADAGVIDRNLFSTMFLNGHEGVLSVGGTAAEEVRRASELVQERLDRFSEWEKKKNNKQSAGFEAPPEEEPVVMERSVTDHIQHKRDPSDWRSEWRFTPTQGAAGWWQILMPGVWINNVKTLKNQPTVIDLSTPFVLAPPSGARAFYAAIPGCVRLPPPHNRFHAFPCLNKPTVHFEFAGWNFPVFRGTRDDSASDGGLGGRLSLGRVAKGSGYCVGAVVETLMGVGHAAGYVRAGGGGGRAGPEAGVLAGNGMRGVWVLGEIGMRGLGIVFDVQGSQVGFRSY
ncbi:aspartic peptidase domain-containing protein [Cryomyces antarcticus]